MRVCMIRHVSKLRTLVFCTIIVCLSGSPVIAAMQSAAETTTRMIALWLVVLKASSVGGVAWPSQCTLAISPYLPPPLVASIKRFDEFMHGRLVLRIQIVKLVHYVNVSIFPFLSHSFQHNMILKKPACGPPYQSCWHSL